MGLDPMLVEACTFAWLGKKRIEKKKINLVNSTGAKPCLLGEIYKIEKEEPQPQVVTALGLSIINFDPSKSSV